MGTTKDIRAAVQAELTFDPRVEAADITVRNMNGQVALNGTVTSYPEYLEAAAAANNALTLNVTVPDNVEATARDGNLTLKGMVEYGRQREAAELAVAVLTGVRNVKDDIQISYDADPADVKWFVQDAWSAGRS